MKKLDFIFFSLFAFCFLLLGCSSKNVNISEIGHYPQPLIKPLTLKIGVYYKDDFQKFETVQKPGGFRLDIQLGKANTALFDYILPLVFKEVTPVQHFPEDIENMANIDTIIEPSIKSFSCNIIHGWETEFHVHITYAITFYSPNGEPIGTWLIKAKGFASYHMSTYGTLAKDATQNAMRDFAVQFMTGLCKNIATKELFDKQCNK
jgi:hypothetical protein